MLSVPRMNDNRKVQFHGNCCLFPQYHLLFFTVLVEAVTTFDISAVMILMTAD